jgi:hypothetical protein
LNTFFHKQTRSEQRLPLFAFESKLEAKEWLSEIWDPYNCEIFPCEIEEYQIYPFKSFISTGRNVTKQESLWNLSTSSIYEKIPKGSLQCKSIKLLKEIL